MIMRIFLPPPPASMSPGKSWIIKCVCYGIMNCWSRNAPSTHRATAWAGLIVAVWKLTITLKRLEMLYEMINGLYYCRACHYIFPAAVLSVRCPDYGKEIQGTDPAIRPANEKEIADYRRIQKELAEENKI